MIEKEALTLGAIVIRPGLVWGENPGGVMGTLERLVSKLMIVPLLIGGNGLHQYLIHEADLAEAIVSLAEARPTRSGMLHSAIHPTPVSLLSILKSIAKRCSKLRLYLPVPWQCVMAVLNLSEALGIHAHFRSDSLTGLVHGNSRPENATPPPGVHYRKFC